MLLAGVSELYVWDSVWLDMGSVIIVLFDLVHWAADLANIDRSRVCEFRKVIYQVLEFICEISRGVYFVLEHTQLVYFTML